LSRFTKTCSHGLFIYNGIDRREEHGFKAIARR
jgi:hypothetical protein